MSYDSARWYTIGGDSGAGSGGYVDNIPENKKSDIYLDYVRNARFYGGALEIRPGYTLFKELTSGDYPRGIGVYTRFTSSDDRIIVRHNQGVNQKLVSITKDGTATAISTSTDIASDDYMEFSSVGDVIYCMNGSDDFGKLSGSIYSTPSTGITNFAPGFAVVFNSSHWASGWSSNPNKVYKSVADNYEDFNSTGSDSFTFNENITGLAATNQALFYFTKNSVNVTGRSDITEVNSEVYYTNRQLDAAEGSINHKSIVKVGNRVYFVTPSLSINMVAQGQDIDGFEVLPLSHREYKGITNFMNSLDDDQSDCFGYYDGKAKLIKWFFKSRGADVNDISVVYDVIRDKFLIDSNKYFYGGVYYDRVSYTISMLEPKVFKDETGQDDDDMPISFRVWLTKLYMGSPTLKNILWENRTLVDINELAELEQSIWIDGESVDTDTLDNSNIPISIGGVGDNPLGDYAVGDGGDLGDDYYETYFLRTKGVLNRKGRTVQLRYENNTLGGKARIKDVELKLEKAPRESTDLTD